MNQGIIAEFRQQEEADCCRKTHYFNGRYENIYIPEDAIPAIKPVLAAARKHACELLGMTDFLSLGFWFNLMKPGHTTTRHRHDDDDELLSAVYYIRAEINSGDLVIYHNENKMRVAPKEGRVVFFKPDIEHEVLENQSASVRLSVGMNFGVKASV